MEGMDMGSYVPEEDWYTSPSIITDRMGPMEHRATRPKLSLSWFLPWPMDESPMPRAMMKGTVIGPVVTPPESNATARKSPGM